MDFEELIRDKEVLVVGNSEDIRGKGDIIDSYEFVIRFNYSIAQPGRYKIGSKCSAWVCGMAKEDAAIMTYKKASIRPEYSIRFCRPCTKPLGNNFIDLSEERWETFLYLKEKFELVGNQNPSTGVSWLYYMVNKCQAKSITLIGFDSFKTPNFYARKVWANMWHDSSKEDSYIKELESKGQVNII